jgi:CRISPR/Cas system-associated protein Cas10 (large subunit of type III CRISPR-Cas system)
VTKKALIYFDIEHIKKYVFGTGKLKEIRGASSILDEFNREKIEEIIFAICDNQGFSQNDYYKIYAGGGGALFIAPSKVAEEIISCVCKKFKEKTDSASITASWIEIKEDDIRENDITQNFDKYQRELINKLHEKSFREARSEYRSLEGFIKNCESCGSFPASHLESQPDTRVKEMICSTCHKKRKQNEKIKNFSSRDSSDKTILNDLLRRLTEASGDKFKNKKFPNDFNEIGKQSRSNKKYMGLIYCDGNNLGRYIEEKINSASDMENFSKKLEEALIDSVVESIDKYLRPKGDILPFDILLLGGDDLVMVTPADRILDVTLHICQNFAIKMQDEGITLSVGLVIAKPSFPFNQYLEIAESLLKSSKLELANRMQKNSSENNQEGIVNFKTISAAGSLKYSDDDYTITTNEYKLIKTMKPYSLKELEKLVCSIKGFKSNNFSTSTLNQMRTIIDQTDVKKTRSEVEIIDSIARMKDEKKMVLLKFLNKFSPDENYTPPWFNTENNGIPVYKTPLLDLVDLYTFVEKEENN